MQLDRWHRTRRGLNSRDLHRNMPKSTRTIASLASLLTSIRMASEKTVGLAPDRALSPERAGPRTECSCSTDCRAISGRAKTSKVREERREMKRRREGEGEDMMLKDPDGEGCSEYGERGRGLFPPLQNTSYSYSYS